MLPSCWRQFLSRRRSPLILFLILFWGIIGLSFVSVQRSPAMTPAIHGVWLTNVDSPVLTDAKELPPAIATLGKTHFNTIYPTVWNWGHTLYPSKKGRATLGRDQDPQMAGRDLLQEIIPLAKSQKMRVIPWLEFGLMAPADSDLARRYSPWLTQRADGSRVWLEGKTHERVWLNPLQPEVRDLITNLALEIVSRYDVDGIQVDDHFGYPADFGYDPFTIALYQQDHGGNSPPIAPALNPNQNCLVTDAAWQDWVNWRSDQISDFFEEFVSTLKRQKPGLVISVSPNPQTFSKNCFLSDWQRWEASGYVDELVLQVYRTKLADFQRELNQPEVQAAKRHIPLIVGILAGLKGRPMPLEQLQAQVQWVQENDFAGMSFFFYESLWNFGPESPDIRRAKFQDWLRPPE